AAGKIFERLDAEPGADLARVTETFPLVVADQQRAEPGASTARVGPASDDQLLAGRALQLAPVRRSPGGIDRVTPFGDQSLPSVFAGVGQQRHGVSVEFLDGTDVRSRSDHLTDKLLAI